MFCFPSSPNLKPLGSSNGVTVLEVGSPLAVIVPGVTVEDVVDVPLQHKSLVLVMFDNGSVGTLNDVV